MHAADDGGEVNVAAAFSGAEQRALDLIGSGEDGGAGVGDAEAAIGVAVETEMEVGMVGCELVEDCGDFFRACAAGGVADDDARDFLGDALGG